jgi:hypothetical protein
MIKPDVWYVFMAYGTMVLPIAGMLVAYYIGEVYGVDAG